MPEELDGQPEEISVKLVTQFFHPDTSANATILTELATGLVERGVDISVLTGQPATSSADRDRTEPKQEVYKEVSIQRVLGARFDKNKSTKYRLLNDISFFLRAFFHLLFGCRNRILLLPTSPPFLPILGWVLKRTGYTYIPVVYDFYPDMAVELGYLSKNSVIYKIWNKLNKHTYKKSDRIITIGETMEETLIEKYGEECNVTVIHNWEDGDFIRPKEKSENDFSQEYGLVDKFTILYSGNLGLHHDLESVVEATRELEEIHPDLSNQLKLLFIGEGGKKPILKEMVADYELETVSFLPYQPEEVLPNSLTSGDIALVTMEEGVEGLCVSSKFYTALASGQAVLAISKPTSEIGYIVEQTNCGIRVDPGNSDQIVAAVSQLLDNPETVAEMGKSAREVFEEKFTKDRSIDKYQKCLAAVS